MKQRKQQGKEKAGKKSIIVPEDPHARIKLKNTLGVIISIFAFVLYAQSISYNYTYDDITVARNNKIITKGISGIPIIIKTDYWYGLEKELRGPVYRPVPLIIFAIEWQLSPGNPHLSHFVNVLLYALTCWLLFLVLCKLFEKQNLVFPFVCALLYTLHPIHSEVVDSIKSCDEILCFLFALLSLFLIIRAVDEKSVFKFILSGICYFGSLLSKETGISFLILTPLALFVFTKSNYKEILRVALMLAFTTGVFFFIRHLVLASVNPNSFRSPLNNSLLAAPDFISQKATAFYVLLKYILLLIFPNPLSYDYSFNQIPIQQISNLPVIFAVIIYFAMGIYAILKIRKRSYVAFAILFYLITLVPVSNIFLLIGSPMAERFMYIPSLGFCMLLTLLLIKLTKTEIIKSKFINTRQLLSMNSSVFLIVFIICMLYSVKIFTRNPDWKDNAALFSHDVKVSDKSARTHFNWANELLKNLYPAGENENKKNDLLDQSIAEYLKAISIYNDAPVYYTTIAEAYSQKNDHLNAISNYETAIKHFAVSDWGLYYNLGHEYLQINQFDKALNAEDSAIKYNPGFTKAYFNKGCALAYKEKYGEAIPVFLKTIAMDSTYAEAYKNLGACYFNTIQYSKAIENYNRALAYDSTYTEVIHLIGLSYQLLGDSVNAKQYMKKYNSKTASNH